MCVPSLERGSHAAGPGSIVAVGPREREDPVASRVAITTARRAETRSRRIHVRSIATGDGLIRGKLLRGFRAVYSLAQRRTAQGRGPDRGIPPRIEPLRRNHFQFEKIKKGHPYRET